LKPENDTTTYAMNERDFISQEILMRIGKSATPARPLKSEIMRQLMIVVIFLSCLTGCKEENTDGIFVSMNVFLSLKSDSGLIF